MWWWIPLRSLWRNRRRTLLSLAIIAFGTAVSFFVLAFLEDSRDQIRQSSVDEYGNLQIASALLFDDKAEGYDQLLTPQQVSAIENILRDEPSYVASTVQLEFPGLAASGDRTQVVRVRAVAPENGLNDFSRFVIEGRPLQQEDIASVLVGRSLANRLGLEVGAVITVTLTTVDGAYNASPLVIAGIYGFSSEQVESQVLLLPLRFGQRLLNTTGIDRVIVGLDRIAATDSARDRIAGALRESGLDLDVRTWDVLSPFYRQLSSYFNLLFGFLTLAVSVLVFFIILQVLTLAFLERTREIGTLRALGTTQSEVFRLFFSESAWLAVLGSGVGILAGVALSLAFNTLGIEWTPPAEVPDEEYPFVLSTGRRLYHYHTRTQTGRCQGLNDLLGEETADISPQDAERLGIANGEMVRVHSRRGEVKVRARVTDEIFPGMVWMAFHFREGCANWITNAAFDPDTWTAEYKACAVQIDKITP